MGYVPAKSEGEYWAVAGACTMISLKIRRARRECFNYRYLQVHFNGTSERVIRVSSAVCVCACACVRMRLFCMDMYSGTSTDLIKCPFVFDPGSDLDACGGCQGKTL